MGKFRNVIAAKISGNVGAMNFRRRGADTVVAERSYENSSAGSGSSEGQRLHRCRLANMVAIFRTIQAIEARAWEGKKPYVSDFNMLTKINLASSPVFLTKEEAALKASVIAPYIVSRGSLPSLKQTYEGNTFKVGVKCGAELDFSLATIGAVSQAILDRNPDWKDGDKLSIACIDQQQDTVSGVVIPVAKVRYIEFTLDVNSTATIDTIPGFVALQFDHDLAGELICYIGGDAAFAIHSRKRSGYLETSEQMVIMKNLLNPIYLQYTSDSQKTKAMDSYGYQGEVLLTPGSEDAGAVSYPAVVSSIMFAGQPVTNGATYTASGDLVIEGEELYPHNVVVANNGTRYVPMVDQTSKQAYTLTSNGTYTVTVNGKLALTFTVNRATGTQSITSFKIDGVTYTSKQDNLSLASNNGALNIEVTGTGLGTITATNGAISGQEGDETHRTAKITATAGKDTYAIMVGGEIIAAGAWFTEY